MPYSVVYNEINAAAHAEGDTIFIYDMPPPSLTVPQKFLSKKKCCHSKQSCHTVLTFACKNQPLFCVVRRIIKR